MNASATPITAVIATYNYGRFVAYAIQSALEQGARVVVVDDGSLDDTPDVVAAFGDRILYHRQRNQGVSAARNAGLQLSATDWVVFLDADDRLLPDALKHIRDSLCRHPAARLHFGHYLSVTGDTRRTAPPQPEMRAPLDNFRRFLQRKFTISTGTACYHRDVFSRIRYPVGMSHGEHLVVDGQVLANFPAVAIPHPLAEIHTHDGRTRDNLDQLIRCGLSTVDALFDPAILPPEALQYRADFVSRWSLSVARACYRARRYAEARKYYELAAANRWTSLCQWPHGFRYLKARWRAA